jgi:hypothetical protein
LAATSIARDKDTWNSALILTIASNISASIEVDAKL